MKNYLFFLISIFLFGCDPQGYTITEDKLEGFTDIEQRHQLDFKGSNFFTPICESSMTLRKHIKNNKEIFFITFYINLNEKIRIGNKESLLLVTDTTKVYFSAIKNTVGSNLYSAEKPCEIIIYHISKKDILNIYNSTEHVFRLKGETGYQDYCLRYPKNYLKKFVDKI